MKTLILGHSGQVATHLRELLPEAQAWGRARQDLTKSGELSNAVAAFAPELIINAAAYTSVDGAEADPQAAWKLNVEAVEVLARVASDLGVPMVHISTDYVFSGRKDGPYSETDPTDPINAYGRSKLAGEVALRSICSNHYLLRTSWVFSEHGGNFVKTMLRLGRERGEVSVVDDQFGIPTYAGDIARLIVAVRENIDNGVLQPGMYHAVGGPAVSWCDFAGQIFDVARRLGIIDRSVKVNPISTAQFPTPAARPANSVLAASGAVSALLPNPIDWRTSLEQMLSNISST